MFPAQDAATQDAGPNDAAVTADASGQNCSGADPISQLLCQLTPAGATEAEGQASIEDLLTTLSGLAGIFGVTGGATGGDAGLGGLFGGGATGGGIDCNNAADPFAQLFCGLGGGAGDGGQGRPFGRRDGGPPAPPADDAGAPIVDDAGVTGSDDASTDISDGASASEQDASADPDGGDASTDDASASPPG